MENSESQKPESSSGSGGEAVHQWPLRVNERLYLMIQLILQFFVHYFKIWNRGDDHQGGAAGGEGEGQENRSSGSGGGKKSKKNRKRKKMSTSDAIVVDSSTSSSNNTVQLTKFEPHTNGISKVGNGITLKPAAQSQGGTNDTLPGGDGSTRKGQGQQTDQERIALIAEQLKAHQVSEGPDMKHLLSEPPEKEGDIGIKLVDSGVDEGTGTLTGTGTPSPKSPLSAVGEGVDGKIVSNKMQLVASRPEPIQLVDGKARKTKVISLVYESNSTGPEMVEEMMSEMESEFRRCAEKGRHVICAEVVWSMAHPPKPPGRKVTWNPNVSSVSYPTSPHHNHYYPYSLRNTNTGTGGTNGSGAGSGTAPGQILGPGGEKLGEKKVEEKIRVAVGKQMVRGKWELTRRLGLPTAPYSQFHEDSRGAGSGQRRRQTGFYRSYTPEFMAYASEDALSQHNPYWNFRPGKEALFNPLPSLSRTPFPEPYARLALNLITVSF